MILIECTGLGIHHVTQVSQFISRILRIGRCPHVRTNIRLQTHPLESGGNLTAQIGQQ